MAAVQQHSHRRHWRKKDGFAGHGQKREDGCVPHGRVLPKSMLVTGLKF